MCFLAGLLAGRAPDLAARLAPPDLKELIADCGFTVSGHPDDAEAVDLFVWVLVEDPAALEGGEVFFLAETAGGETYRSEPTDMQESMEGGFLFRYPDKCPMRRCPSMWVCGETGGNSSRL